MEAQPADWRLAPHAARGPALDYSASRFSGQTAGGGWSCSKTKKEIWPGPPRGIRPAHAAPGGQVLGYQDLVGFRVPSMSSSSRGPNYRHHIGVVTMRCGNCVRNRDRHRFGRRRIFSSRSTSSIPRPNFLGEQGGLIAEPSEPTGRLGLLDLRVARWGTSCCWDG